MSTTRRSPLLSVWLLLGYTFLYAPIVILIVFSFNESKLVTVWAGFSTKWYWELFQDRQMLMAAWLSLRLALMSATSAAALGVFAGLVMARFGRFRGHNLFAGMITAPSLAPDTPISAESYYAAWLAAGACVNGIDSLMAKTCDAFFAFVRPPGHHASASSSWGFCYFNNMAISLHALKRKHRIDTAFVLDFDLHFGDGNVNILERNPWVEILNPEAADRDAYLEEVRIALEDTAADMIAVSAGFDNHVEDWGGLLYTEDYEEIGYRVRSAADRNEGGCFGILEGGYNHEVLGENVLALIQGMDRG